MLAVVLAVTLVVSMLPLAVTSPLLLPKEELAGRLDLEEPLISGLRCLQLQQSEEQVIQVGEVSPLASSFNGWSLGIAFSKAIAQKPLLR